MWHLSGGQVPPTASMQPAGPPGRQLIEKDRLWETYRGRNPAYSRHHEPAATNESDRHVSYDLGWITSYYRGTEYYIYNIYIKYITWITLHLQKPKIRRIGARFESVLFTKGHRIKGAGVRTSWTPPASAPEMFVKDEAKVSSRVGGVK